MTAAIAYRTAERLEEKRARELPEPGEGRDTPDPAPAGTSGAARAAYAAGSVVDVHDYSAKRASRTGTR